MRFLIDADLPRSAGEVVRRHGHEAVDTRDIGLRSAKDPVEVSLQSSFLLSLFSPFASCVSKRQP